MNPFFRKDQIVLFQGDSITDCERDRYNPNSLGSGYPAKISAIYKELFQDQEVTFFNRGVSGDRVHNLIERYPEDIMDIEPDFLSILIGINDVWRRYDSNDPGTPEAFRDHYEYLLKMIKKHLPDTKIMLIEPFLLHTLPDTVVWHEDLDPKIQIVREMASRYADYYLPLDGIFASYCVGEYSPAELAKDGVHPTQAGHSVIAVEYLKLLRIL
jgi:acyl-CoA thioesterase I